MAVVLTCAVAACATSTGTESGGGLGTSPTAPTQIGQDGRGPVRVTRVRVFMKDGRPQAFVEGEIGDGCNHLDSMTQTRTSHAVAITATLRRQGEQCTMVMQYLNRWVPLDGSFAPGDYTVSANSVTIAFRLAAGGDGMLRVDPDPGPLPRDAGAPDAAVTSPAWLAILIQQLEMQPVANPPAFVASYEYNGEIVYFVPQRCCDIASLVYRSDGTIICNADGGFTGKGDGRCPDFFAARRNERIIWRDPRG
jgi:hypothetical protein